MKAKAIFVALCSVALVAPLAAQQVQDFLGRWDITATPATGKPYPQWMELTGTASTITGKVQPRGGAWRPIEGAHLQGDTLIVDLGDNGSGQHDTWELTRTGAGQLSGTEKRGSAAPTTNLVAVHAPLLDRPMPARWTEPVPLFNGKDLTGWQPIGNVGNSKWVARDGELVNDNPEGPGQSNGGAANLRTTQTFQDFKLHIEVKCPPGGNSGIYLRGRYEIQVGTEGGKLPTHEMGAVYSWYPPPQDAELALGKWSSFDITFVGRHVTVLRDGKLYHNNVEIPGPTGGALDSHESEPGPFFLQGDHHGMIRYRNITVSVPRQ